MRVRMLTTAASPDGILAAGTVVTVAEELGQQLIAGRYAAALDEPKPAGGAVKPAVRVKGRAAAPPGA